MISSDNSIQINIKFTFTGYEYIIAYEYILLSKLIYIYIYIYTYIYIYIYTHIYISHWFHIQAIFSSWLYLIIVTSRNSLPNCEYDPIINKEARAT